MNALSSMQQAMPTFPAPQVRTPPVEIRDHIDSVLVGGGVTDEAGEARRRLACTTAAVGGGISGLVGLGLSLAFGNEVGYAASIATGAICAALTCSAVLEVTGGLRDGGEYAPVAILPWTTAIACSHSTLHPAVTAALLAVAAVGIHALLRKAGHVFRPASMEGKATLLRELSEKYQRYDTQHEELKRKMAANGAP